MAAIKPAPHVVPWAASYLDAFHALSADRPINLDGVGGIPFASKLAYIQLYKVDDVALWLDIIGSLDRAFLHHVHRVKEMRSKVDKRRG